jgi:hypothetical protein
VLGTVTFELLEPVEVAVAVYGLPVGTLLKVTTPLPAPLDPVFAVTE